MDFKCLAKMGILKGVAHDVDSFGYLITPPIGLVRTIMISSDFVPPLRDGYPSFNPSND